MVFPVPVLLAAPDDEGPFLFRFCDPHSINNKISGFEILKNAVNSTQIR